MKITRIIVMTAIVAAFSSQMGQAQNLRNADEPAEFPPASYKGTQYVDSRGCVYIRAGISGNVTWIPRVSRKRTQICGQTPTGGSRTTAKPVATPKPKPVAVKPASKPVARVVRRVPKPSAKPVVRKIQRPAAVAVAKAAPRQIVPAPVQPRPVAAPAAQSGSCGASSLSRKYINVNSGLSVRCGPQQGRIAAPQPSQPRRVTSVPQGIATGGTVNSGTRVLPRHVQVNRQNTQNTTVPTGYLHVWEDDRLNPNRAEQTIGGILATNYLWTNTVPRRLINTQTRQDVTASVPLIYPYVDQVTQRRELGTVSIVHRDGQTLKRIVRNKSGYRQPIVREPVVSTRSAPVQAAPKVQRSKPVAAASGQYVQVGTFGQVDNAQATAQRIKALGLPVRVSKFTRGGKTYRLVLAGPFAGNAAGALAQVRRAGYGDAFLRK